MLSSGLWIENVVSFPIPVFAPILVLSYYCTKLFRYYLHWSATSSLRWKHTTKDRASSLQSSIQGLFLIYISLYVHAISDLEILDLQSQNGQFVLRSFSWCFTVVLHLQTQN